MANNSGCRSRRFTEKKRRMGLKQWWEGRTKYLSGKQRGRKFSQDKGRWMMREKGDHWREWSVQALDKHLRRTVTGKSPSSLIWPKIFRRSCVSSWKYGIHQTVVRTCLDTAFLSIFSLVWKSVQHWGDPLLLLVYAVGPPSRGDTQTCPRTHLSQIIISCDSPPSLQLQDTVNPREGFPCLFSVGWCWSPNLRTALPLLDGFALASP